MTTGNHETNASDFPGDDVKTAYDQQGDRVDGPKKQASPAFKDTPAQADGATFQIIGDPGPLFAALAAAQGAFLEIHKNRTVTVRPRDKAAYTFDYATLDQVLAACRPALSANGLAIVQPFYHGPNGLELRTILAHASGARLEAVTELPKVDSIQGAGSALTYLKRYQVQAILGVSSEEDDDGNAADGNQVQAMQARDRSKPAAPPATTPRKGPSKPQDAPASKEPQAPAPKAAEPKAPPPSDTPAPTDLLATATQLADLKALLLSLQFKGTLAKDCVSILTGDDWSRLTGPGAILVTDVLKVAADSKWDAERVMNLIHEQAKESSPAPPNATEVIKAIIDETAAMGGGS